MNARAVAGAIAALVTLVLVLAAGAGATERARGAAATPMAKTDPDAGEAALAQQVQQLDDRLTAAFDAHDLDALMALFADDLEFFHDKGGLQHLADVRAGFARLFAQNNGIRRELVPGSLRVYPVPGYGAMELGAHRFCHLENGRDDCGTFEFMHVWRHDDAEWKLARVVSYGH